MLGQTIVDLAGEARPLLERGALCVVDAHAVESGVGRAQGAQVAALVGDGAGHEDRVGHQTHDVRDGHEVGVDAGPEGVLDLGHEQDDEPDRGEGVAHRAAAAPGHAVEDDGGQQAGHGGHHEDEGEAREAGQQPELAGLGEQGLEARLLDERRQEVAHRDRSTIVPRPMMATGRKTLRTRRRVPP